jgi:hypothetical protein
MQKNNEHDPNRTRVIYIMGAGRSGSTVLDTVLGNHPDIVSVGELANLHRFGWTNGEYCACGLPGNTCGFWSAVRGQWEGMSRPVGVWEYLSLQDRYELFRHLGYGQWVRLGRERMWPSARFSTYLAATGAVFAAVRAVSGRRVVVDSSKSPLRAALLSLTPGIDVCLIHLVRDGRAVAWSRKKAFRADERRGICLDTKPRPAAYSAAYWAAVNVLSACVRRTLPNRSLLVRYEDFVTDPESVLARIGRLAGVDLAGVAEAARASREMAVGHTIAGNRLRMNGSLKLKPDLVWQQRLPRADRRVCWTVAGWLLRQYGYCR